MEITRETPINFIVFNANIDKKTLYNGPIARMCMDSWKRAFPNLNIINIDVTEEIANMNEFSKFAYSHNLKNYTTDPLRLYYINQYDNCVYCDYDVVINITYIKILLKMLNKNNTFIIKCTGTFTWNRYKNSQNYKDYYIRYNMIGSSLYKQSKKYFIYHINKFYNFYNFMLDNNYSDFQLDFSSIKHINLNQIVCHITALDTYKKYNFFNMKNINTKYYWFFYIKRYESLNIICITNRLYKDL